MIRWGCSIATAALVALMVGAQGPPGPTAPEQARMYHQNRFLVDRLVKSSLEMADASSELGRVGASNGLARQIASEIHAATRTGEFDRVAELGRHLDAMVRHGIIPNLSSARDRIAPGSMEEDELRDRHAETLRTLDHLMEVLGEERFETELDDVRELREALHEASERLRQAVGTVE